MSTSLHCWVFLPHLNVLSCFRKTFQASFSRFEENENNRDSSLGGNRQARFVSVFILHFS